MAIVLMVLVALAVLAVAVLLFRASGTTRV